MKKIFLSLLFVAFSISMNAQSAVERDVIKNSANELYQFVEEDINIIETNFSTLNESQKKALVDLYYYKYKMLTSELTSDELIDLTESMKARTKVVLGDDLYMEISENQNIFYRITGLAYLAH